MKKLFVLAFLLVFLLGVVIGAGISGFMAEKRAAGHSATFQVYFTDSGSGMDRPGYHFDHENIKARIIAKYVSPQIEYCLTKFFLVLNGTMFVEGPAGGILTENLIRSIDAAARMNLELLEQGEKNDGSSEGSEKGRNFPL